MYIYVGLRILCQFSYFLKGRNDPKIVLKLFRIFTEAGFASRSCRLPALEAAEPPLAHRSRFQATIWHLCKASLFPSLFAHIEMPQTSGQICFLGTLRRLGKSKSSDFVKYILKKSLYQETRF